MRTIQSLALLAAAGVAITASTASAFLQPNAGAPPAAGAVGRVVRGAATISETAAAAGSKVRSFTQFGGGACLPGELVGVLLYCMCSLVDNGGKGARVRRQRGGGLILRPEQPINPLHPLPTTAAAVPHHRDGPPDVQRGPRGDGARADAAPRDGAQLGQGQGGHAGAYGGAGGRTDGSVGSRQ